MKTKGYFNSFDGIVSCSFPAAKPYLWSQLLLSSIMYSIHKKRVQMIRKIDNTKRQKKVKERKDTSPSNHARPVILSAMKFGVGNAFPHLQRCFNFILLSCFFLLFSSFLSCPSLSLLGLSLFFIYICSLV